MNFAVQSPLWDFPLSCASAPLPCRFAAGARIGGGLLVKTLSRPGSRFQGSMAPKIYFQNLSDFACITLATPL